MTRIVDIRDGAPVVFASPGARIVKRAPAEDPAVERHLQDLDRELAALRARVQELERMIALLRPGAS
jgi:hypothetical protein